MVHIPIWQGDDVLRVPLGALFRAATDWAVFRIVDGKAVATRVDLGHRNNTTAEVVDGLAPATRSSFTRATGSSTASPSRTRTERRAA